MSRYHCSQTRETLKYLNIVPKIQKKLNQNHYKFQCSNESHENRIKSLALILASPHFVA